MATTDWNPILRGEFDKPYWHDLQQFVADRAPAPSRSTRPHADVFAALHLTPYADTRVLILGQDPYHGPRPGARPVLLGAGRRGDPALARQHPSRVGRRPRRRRARPRQPRGVGAPGRAAAERHADGARRAGRLAPGQGMGDVHRRGDHRRQRQARARRVRAVGQLCPQEAGADRHQHGTPIIESPHPSPLSAHNGFFGSQPFSRANAALVAHGQQPIDWTL